jgi:predicted RNA-binding Zn ribbon-like protein
MNPGVLRLHHPDGQVFRFEPGSVALAFGVTGTERDERFETLHTPADLKRWAADVLGATRAKASSADLADAKRLRDAIWRAAEAVVDGRAVDIADRRTLNAFAAEPSLALRLEAHGRRSWSAPQTIDGVFSTLARDIIDVVSGPLSRRLKRCDGSRCALLFVDTSRPGSRRWCSMDRCGNRAKVSAHRRRNREEAHA